MYRHVLAFFLVAIGTFCFASDVKKVKSEADLPRFSYPVDAKLETLLAAEPASFQAFSDPVGRDIDSVLSNYQIEDRSTLTKLLTAKLDLMILAGGRDLDALQLIQKIRAIQDKPSVRDLFYSQEEAFLKARLASPTAAGACPVSYAKLYRQRLDALKWDEIATDIKHDKGFAGLPSKAFLGGFAESELSPSIMKEHALDLAGASALIGYRKQIETTVPCVPDTVRVLTSYVQTNIIVKPSIWQARELDLTRTPGLTPVNVGIWDSGFDTKLFPGRLYLNHPNGTDDPHGLAFDKTGGRTHGDLIPLTPQQAKDYPLLVHDIQGLGDMENGVDSAEAEALQAKVATLKPDEMGSLIDELTILIGFAHGTHVAGIAARGNPAIRLAYSRTTYDNDNPHMPPSESLQKSQDREYGESVAWFRAHHIRVVNMSWWDRPSNTEKDLADNGIGKDADERKRLAHRYFEMEKAAELKAFRSAPDILFITIAGNSNADNAFEDVIPSSLQLPNLIVIGAVDQAGDETSFTSYGQNVLVDAEGLSVESVVPGGALVKESGTSMAAPQVTNLAAKLLAIDPTLTPAALIALIHDGATKSDDGRRLLLNPKRSYDLLMDKRKTN